MKLIKVSAIWCPSCLVMNNRLNKILKNYDVKVEEYDYDIDTDEVEKLNIGKVLPVLIFIQDNKEIKRLIGEIGEKELIKEISDLL